MGDRRNIKKSILLVEDHTDTRDMLRLVLVRRGYNVLEACGAGDAKVLAQAEPFDLLISDIGLADADGCALLADLRVELPRLQAIALTAYAYPADQLRCRAAGFGWFLTKPVEINRLISTIESALLAASTDASEDRSA